MPLWLLPVEPLVLIEPIEPTPCEDEAVAPPVLEPVLEPAEPVEPVEGVWSLPWFAWVLLFRLPELPELPWLPAVLPAVLPALLPFASLDF
jgi:hypothetical protein